MREEDNLLIPLLLKNQADKPSNDIHADTAHMSKCIRDWEVNHEKSVAEKKCEIDIYCF